ncbi:MAG: hypothetical protein HOD97_05840 [Candidatus Marinimicrobia bacterium]|jgi:hypothetical protein|nr:hypothetical protein [Candidatus Neomarinimicrobiota bacterium]MBT3617489.1 hypothetical protein [Candidatus Neomarinimicrobiota bacterium]MBT3829429.1 hypothetical protein [Candidatus Neomarinimicrobiota bacterium]MBT3996989.1 hypothetical protein [Candidatus Neomarinimicrobiota bacterium]MBT4281115.1 hypothetical protein [Candidatus Neomarinimicrobiota bacterium]
MRFNYIGIIFLGLGYPQAQATILNTPIYFNIKLTNGYDSNVLRFSSGEQESAAVEPDLMGGMSTFDSHYLRGELLGKSIFNFSRKRNITFSGRAALIRYSHSQEKQYTSGKIELKYSWGPYRSFKYSIRDLSDYYLRDYVNKDVTNTQFIACMFSDRDQQIALSYPIVRRTWISLAGGYLQRYFNGDFSEFDLDILYQKGRISWKTPWNLTMSIEGEIGKADNITFGETARASDLDRSYQYSQFYFPLKSSTSLWLLDELGGAFRQEIRQYAAESLDDPLHSGRAHTDRKLDIWMKKNISESLSVKLMVRNRERITHSNYSWVQKLKSFRQVQVWVEIGWRSVYDKY